jgi:hypothetical protein
MSEIKTGKFKVFIRSGMFSQWVFFDYKIIDGLTQIKNSNNSFAEWHVGTIPSGAVLIT